MKAVTNKPTKQPKPKIQTISLNQFKQNAIDSAIEVKMSNSKFIHLHTSFNNISKNDGLDETTFSVHYFLEDANYYGSGITPEIAIQSAIDRFLIATEQTRINPQVKIDPTKDHDVQVTLKDGMITIAAKAYNMLQQKFVDVTQITVLEASEYLKTILTAL